MSVTGRSTQHSSAVGPIGVAVTVSPAPAGRGRWSTPCPLRAVQEFRRVQRMTPHDADRAPPREHSPPPAGSASRNPIASAGHQLPPSHRPPRPNRVRAAGTMVSTPVRNRTGPERSAGCTKAENTSLPVPGPNRCGMAGVYGHLGRTWSARARALAVHDAPDRSDGLVADPRVDTSSPILWCSMLLCCARSLTMRPRSEFLMSRRATYRSIG